MSHAANARADRGFPDGQSVSRPLLRVVDDFDAFYRREFKGLLGLAVALTGDGALAEELVQDAMVVAARRWPEISRLDSPVGWLRRVVANRSTSAIRRRIVEAKALTRLGRRAEDGYSYNMPSDAQHLWEQVRRLPKRQAQVVAIRALYRLSLAETAEVLDISKESVQVHLRRARAKLAEQLDEEPE